MKRFIQIKKQTGEQFDPVGILLDCYWVKFS